MDLRPATSSASLAHPPPGPLVFPSAAPGLNCLVLSVTWDPASPRLAGGRDTVPVVPSKAELKGFSSCESFWKETEKPIRGKLLKAPGWQGVAIQARRSGSPAGILTLPARGCQHLANSISSLSQQSPTRRGSSNRNVFSQSSGGCQPQIQAPADSAPGEGSSWLAALSPCGLSSALVQAERELCVSSSSSFFF